MKKIYLLLITILVSCSSPKDYNIKTVSVKEFKDFIDATGYITSAEEYGWSFVQENVYDYKIVNGANWTKPDGINKSIDSLPVTQVSYKDALEYCKWAGVRLPTYEEYWKFVASDDRLIVSDNLYPISDVKSVNIVGNVWDITEPDNTDQVRLAGGSTFLFNRYLSWNSRG